MRSIKKTKNAYIIASIITVLVGLFLVIFPKTTLISFSCLIGVVTVAFGIVKILGYYSKDLFRLAFQFDLAIGIMAIVTGTIIFIHPQGIVKVIHVIIGVFVLTEGLFRIQTARDSRDFGMQYWWAITVLSVITCAGGIALILFPFKSAAALTVFTGFAIILDGIQNLVAAAYTVKPVSSKDEKIIYTDVQEKR